MVKDIGSGYLDGSPYGFAVIGNTLYFTANDAINGYELWKSDGTESGTMMVRDIASGVQAVTRVHSRPLEILFSLFQMVAYTHTQNQLPLHMRVTSTV